MDLGQVRTELFVDCPRLLNVLADQPMSAMDAGSVDTHRKEL